MRGHGHRRSDPCRCYATDTSGTDTDLQATLKAAWIQRRGRVSQTRTFRPDIDRGLRLGRGRPESQADRGVASRVIDLRPGLSDGQQGFDVVRLRHDDEVASFTGTDRGHRSKICQREITIKRLPG